MLWWLLSVVFVDGLIAAEFTSRASDLSKKFRNWTYFHGEFDGFVVPPLAGGFNNQSKVDCAVVFEAAAEDKVGGGPWRMIYTYFIDDAGDKQSGYQSALATSSNLTHWSFGQGGDAGTVLERDNDPSVFDYGGATFGCPLWEDQELTSARKLKKQPDGRYYALYGAYSARDGYESGSGANGVAWSEDGVVWKRMPHYAIGPQGAAEWESGHIYQPNMVLADSKVYNFYNAKGTNRAGVQAEETGLATVSLNEFPGVSGSSIWQRDADSPVLPSGSAGGCDTTMASDPKVFWDQEQSTYVMFYFGVGDGTHGHAAIMVAFSTDLLYWEKDPVPLYLAGGHPDGIDSDHAHKVSVVYSGGIGYLFYTAVGAKGRGIALLTSQPLKHEPM